jgi:hypothetical protein
MFILIFFPNLASIERKSPFTYLPGVEIMAEQTTTAAKKAAPKRKTAARKTAARKTTAARKPAARKAAPRKAARKAQPEFTAKAQETSRKLFLAGLGVYGKVFDGVEEQLKSAEKRMEQRRKKADKLYAELVKRGEKLEKDTRKSIDELELPELKLPKMDRKELEAQLEKARARFNDLKDSFGIKSAA